MTSISTYLLKAFLEARSTSEETLVLNSLKRPNWELWWLQEKGCGVVVHSISVSLIDRVQGAIAVQCLVQRNGEGDRDRAWLRWQAKESMQAVRERKR